jgi:hypothetical protein
MYVGKDATVIVDSRQMVLTVWPNSVDGFRNKEYKDSNLKRLDEKDIALLKACLTKYKPDLLSKIQQLEVGELSDNLINKMPTAVGTEFLNVGFNADGSPTELGLRLEELISTLSHYWKSRVSNLKAKQP